MCGVEGVRLAGGSDEEETLVGGVLDGSFMVVACVDVISGDIAGGVG